MTNELRVLTWGFYCRWLKKTNVSLLLSCFLELMRSLTTEVNDCLHPLYGMQIGLIIYYSSSHSVLSKKMVDVCCWNFNVLISDKRSSFKSHILPDKIAFPYIPQINSFGVWSPANVAFLFSNDLVLLVQFLSHTVICSVCAVVLRCAVQCCHIR